MKAFDAQDDVNDDSVEALDAQVEHEDEKNLQVALANAIINPSAMMVHSEHTAPAFTAMMRAWRLDALTLKAKAHEFFLKVLNLLVC